MGEGVAIKQTASPTSNNEGHKPLEYYLWSAEGRILFNLEFYTFPTKLCFQSEGKINWEKIKSEDEVNLESLLSSWKNIKDEFPGRFGVCDVAASKGKSEYEGR